ncbi:response regulator [Candidatus Parcubacteria bacterium]|nr:response regulator [Candidatus Parcubacteria bacterium]
MSNHKKVLLIEDFPIIQTLYSEPLKSHGYDVDIASDGAAALERVAENSYDFILLDLLLPNVNGIEFLEKFQNRPKKTKIIVLSDFSDDKTILKAKKLGVDKYLIKAENTPSQLTEKLDNFKS